MPTTETRKMVLAAVAVCEDKKAEDTRILELDPADSGFTDFFLITSGTNTRQTVAIADEIEMKMKREFGTYANSVEGRRTGEWILMDYVDFVVHIFVEEKRAFYDIERLRKTARSLHTQDLESALKKKTAAARKQHPVPAVAAGDAQAEAPARAAKRSVGAKTAAPRKTAGRKAAAKKSATKSAAGARKSAAKKTPAKKSATRMAAAAAAKPELPKAETPKAKVLKPRAAAKKAAPRKTTKGKGK